MTTVKDLIDHLSKFPPDAPVLQQLYSEVGDLDLEDVEFVPGEKSKLIRQERSWGGDYITFHPSYEKPGYVPQFVDAVHFPGN